MLNASTATITKITSLFETEEFKGHATPWHRRQLELAYRKAYYDGTVYRTVRERFMALGKLSPLIGPRLYRGTKALFLMLSRAVDVDAGIVPGGWKLAEGAPRTWETGIKQVMAWSDWARDGVLYAHYGAQYGVSTLKVSDLREQQRVVVRPVDPATVYLVRERQYDPTPTAAIVVEQRISPTGEAYEYAEVITPEWVRTFAGGQPVSIDGRPAEYRNEQGIVPLVEVRHIHVGDELGECTYQKAIPLLDEVNELASYLADIIRKHAEAQWAVIGAEASSDLVKSGDNVWFVPQGGDVKALVAGIDIAGVLAFITTIRDEVHGSLPELAFDELKSKTQIATATLELQLMELVLKIKRCRPNYDHGLADALRLAGRVGATMGLRDLAPLDDEGLTFDEERPVLPMDKQTLLQLEQQALALEQQRAIAQQPEASLGRMQPETQRREEDEDA